MGVSGVRAVHSNIGTVNLKKVFDVICDSPSFLGGTKPLMVFMSTLGF